MNLSRHKSTKVTTLILIVLLVILAGVFIIKRESLIPLFLHMKAHTIKLPAPLYHSNTSIEEALKQRRSIRQYKNEALSMQQVAQILWAAQGITSVGSFRTAPSAAALYPLHLYLISGKVSGLDAGVYLYLPEQHELEKLITGDKRNELLALAEGQNAVKEGAIDLLITAHYKNTTDKYGKRGERFVDTEAGLAAENIYLQAVSLGLGTVLIGTFDEGALKKLLKIPNDEEPLYLMPVGKP